MPSFNFGVQNMNQLNYLAAITADMKKCYCEGKDDEAEDLAERIIDDPIMTTSFKSQAYMCRGDIRERNERNDEAMKDYGECIRLLERDGAEGKDAHYLTVARRRVERLRIRAEYDGEIGPDYEDTGVMPGESLVGRRPESIQRLTNQMPEPALEAIAAKQPSNRIPSTDVA